MLRGRYCGPTQATIYQNKNKVEQLAKNLGLVVVEALFSVSILGLVE
jgi:hypothetical protein